MQEEDLGNRDERSKLKAELTTSMLGMTKECEEEHDIDRRIEILYKINSIMPNPNG